MDAINGGIENLDLGGTPESTALSSGPPGGVNASPSVEADGVEGEIGGHGQEETDEDKLENGGAEKKGSETNLDGGKVAPLPEEEEGMEEGKKMVPFPQRNGKLDCSYYIRTGRCAYGANCKFNHPPRTGRNNQVAPRDSSEPVHAVNKVETEEHLGGQQIECKYYLMPRGCKFGKSCKYGHSEQPAMLNFLGLPLRPGQKECPYYMRSGSCKFSSNCRFNHPDPVAVEGHASLSGYQNSGSLHHSVSLPSRSSTNFSRGPLSGSASFSNVSSSYLPSIPFQPKGFSLHPKPKDYQAFAAHARPPFLNTSLDDTTTKVENYTNKHLQMDFPERPGQPECPYFMKTGDCKFRLACKFHHPRSHLSEVSIYDLSPCGLPLRPDKEICAFYSRFGICKYGPACKFHHPVDFSPSASTSAKSSEDTSVSGNYRANEPRMEEDNNKLVEQSA